MTADKQHTFRQGNEYNQTTSYFSILLLNCRNKVVVEDGDGGGARSDAAPKCDIHAPRHNAVCVVPLTHRVLGVDTQYVRYGGRRLVIMKTMLAVTNRY